MSATHVFRDRREAGQVLAAAVRHEVPAENCVVLALARSGVPVGVEVAHAIGAPLDVLVVRKLGVPMRPELTMGAIAIGGLEVLDDLVVAELGLTPFAIATVADRELAELARREALYRQGRPPPDVRHRVAVVVDDGLATGVSMRAAIAAVRELQPAQVVVATPVGDARAMDRLVEAVDRVVCPVRTEHGGAIASWYSDDHVTDDGEVCQCLAEAASAAGVEPGGARRR